MWNWNPRQRGENAACTIFGTEMTKCFQNQRNTKL